MGFGWVHEGLLQLKEHLDSVLRRDVQTAAQRESLARQAHILVSRAGIFGFSELARLSSEVEEACGKGKPLEAALNKLQVRADDARAAVDRTLKNEAGRVSANGPRYAR
jgi:HPt (histidine-containing phosphotransfer) domain-containing protein